MPSSTLTNTISAFVMEGLGEGYEAFVERLQSDFAAANASKSSGQNGNINSDTGTKLNRGAFPSHVSQSQLHQSKYVGYPSPANAFTVERDKSPSVSESSNRSGRSLIDISREETSTLPRPTGLSSQLRNLKADLNDVSEIPYPHRGHRRAQSEFAIRLPDDITFDFEPGFLDSSTIPDELGDNLLSMHIDTDRKNSSSATSMALSGMKTSGEFTGLPVPLPHHTRSLSVDRVLAGLDSKDDAFGLAGVVLTERVRSRHSHSNSMDGSTTLHSELFNSSTESSEGKKAAAANKLAELALIDPKRAKRILANRQSAARSKERKMRYIAELERKLQSLQTEATALSAQLTMMQKDTTSLTAENSELKFQLQSIEQEGLLRNALNRALKDEVQRLKLATGEIVTGNGQLLKHIDQSFLSGKSFYQARQMPDSILAGQQLHQLQSALNSQQSGKRQTFLQPASLPTQQGLSAEIISPNTKSEGLSITSSTA